MIIDRNFCPSSKSPTSRKISIYKKRRDVFNLQEKVDRLNNAHQKWHASLKARTDLDNQNEKLQTQRRTYEAARKEEEVLAVNAAQRLANFSQGREKLENIPEEKSRFSDYFSSKAKSPLLQKREDLQKAIGQLDNAASIAQLRAERAKQKAKEEHEKFSEMDKQLVEKCQIFVKQFNEKILEAELKSATRSITEAEINQAIMENMITEDVAQSARQVKRENELLRAQKKIRDIRSQDLER
jgi:hypothetical protein